MVDKYGAVRTAVQHADGSTVLDPVPVAHLGAGRPLGFAHDAEGNLVVCDALKVSEVSQQRPSRRSVGPSRSFGTSHVRLENLPLSGLLHLLTGITSILCAL